MLLAICLRLDFTASLKRGEAFIGKYKAMLSATPCCTIEEAGAMMGIDLTKKDFWRTGLSEIAEEIEQFCTM